MGCDLIRLIFINMEVVSILAVSCVQLLHASTFQFFPISYIFAQIFSYFVLFQFFFAIFPEKVHPCLYFNRLEKNKCISHFVESESTLIRRFPVLIALWTQPHYKVPNDKWVKIRLPSCQCSTVGNIFYFFIRKIRQTAILNYISCVIFQVLLL